MAKKKDVSVVIMVLIIIAVAVLGGFAVAPTIGNIVSQNRTQKIAERISNGTATVDDLADGEGMTVDEYLAKYEVSSDDANGDTSMGEFGEKLTLKNYCTYVGVTYSDESLEAYKLIYESQKDESEDGDEEKVEITADTKDMEAKYGFAQYLYALQQNSADSDDVTATDDLTEENAETPAE